MAGAKSRCPAPTLYGSGWASSRVRAGLAPALVFSSLQTSLWYKRAEPATQPGKHVSRAGLLIFLILRKLRGMAQTPQQEPHRRGIGRATDRVGQSVQAQRRAHTRR